MAFVVDAKTTIAMLNNELFFIFLFPFLLKSLLMLNFDQYMFGFRKEYSHKFHIDANYMLYG
jgi:hypothetical protein